MSESTSQTKAEILRDFEIGSKQENFEFSISLPEDNVEKILSASASVVIDKYEALLGELSFSGQACLNIVYALSDGTISNYKTCQDISGKFENLLFDPSSIVKIIPNVIEISIEKGTENAIKVKISLENAFSMVKNQEISIFKNQEENVFVKETEIEIPKFIGESCHNFVQTSVFETKFPVEKILNYSSIAAVTKADSLDGVIVFEGETITKLLYSTKDDRPVLVSLINKDLFREEVENQNTTKESTIEANAIVVEKDIDENINPENKTVEISIPVKICYDIFELNKTTVTADCYSTENQLQLSTEAFISTELVQTEIFDNKIDGSVSVDEQTLRIDKILAVDGVYLTKLNESYENGELKSEGTVHLNVIYINDEEENVNSVSIEIPYAFKEKIGEEQQLRARTNSQIVEIDAVVKRGRDIYVDGKIRTQVWLLKDSEKAVVCEIVKGDKFEERDGAIEIFFAEEGKYFWDIAKELKVSENKLKEQNSSITEPFGAQEKIIYFQQYNIQED